MRALGLEPRREEIKKFQQEFDSQNTGFIDLNDFIRIMTIKMTEKDTKEQIVKSFELFDTNKTGKIAFNDIKRIANILGQNLSDEEIYEIIDEADRDGDGFLNFNEFATIMRTTTL